MKILRFYLIMLALNASTIVAAQRITDTIPFKLEEHAIIIIAKIDGQSCRLVFDTGDPLTRVFPEELGWKPAINKDKSGKIKQAQLQIGTYAQQVDIYAFGATRACPEAGMDGVIGYNFMKDKIWMIDYRKEKIYILESPPPANEALHVIPFFVIPGKSLWKELLAEIKINGKPYIVKSNGRESKPFLKFDTGFVSRGGTISLLLNNHFLMEECNAPDSYDCKEVCGKQYCFLNGVGVNLSFNNDINFSVKATAEQVSQNSYALLGNVFFERYKPVFDLKNNQLILLSKE
jgi:hypothetical protein